MCWTAPGGSRSCPAWPLCWWCSPSTSLATGSATFWTPSCASSKVDGGYGMDFYAVLDQAIDLLRQRGRLTYRVLKLQFQLDNDALEILKEELIKAQRLAIDENSEVLVWTGDAATPPATAPDQAPLAYTPSHLTEKILASRSTLAGERKQVTVLFADIKDSTELIRDLDAEAAQQLLDPLIHRMMDAVHRFEGTVNQVLGDGSVIKRLLSSTASKAYGSASSHGIACELCTSASPLGGQCYLSSPRVLH